MVSQGEVKQEKEIILKTENLYFGYRYLNVLKNVHFHLYKGELCSIIGPNGAGKTTFLNVLCGKFIPQQGTIMYKGMDISKMPPHRKRELGISRSFQILNIFEDKTIFENARYAVQAVQKDKYSFWKRIDNEEIEAQTYRLLEQCLLLDKAHLVCNELAYAEKRLVEIALSLAGDPEVLLLDEPTAGLSVEESKYMAQFIKNLTTNFDVSIVFIEHDMDLVFDISDRIAVLYYGELIVNDVPDVVRNHQKVREVYLGDALNA